MQFTEINFALFLIAVFIIYWLMLRRWLFAQNAFLLCASYLFYGWWDWRFLSLIMLTTLTTYVAAKYSGGKYGKLLTAGNIVLNVGILVVFKYLGFFLENAHRVLSALGCNTEYVTLDILLPVGLSFYTFQAIAYSVDVYRHRIEPCARLLDFATFIAYFPQLVAGPIERASQLLPQIFRERQWDYAYAVSGLRMLLFGVLKKVCVANMLALYADRLFECADSPLYVVAAGVVFTLEIYFDFSAYSEIARGVSRLLGIELMANFRFPYFSRNVLEFWRRWHISLMWWFRDYVYIPLGGSRCRPYKTAGNIAVVFLLSGLWHGAAWNFVLWGLYWAFVFIVAKMVLKLPKREDKIELSQLPQIMLTWSVVCFGFYLFRCSQWEQVCRGFVYVWAFAALFFLCWGVSVVVCRNKRIFSATCVSAVLGIVIVWGWLSPPWPLLLKAWWLVPALLAGVVEWKNRNNDCPTAVVSSRRWVRWSFYWICMLLILLSEPVDMTFIYFQF